METGRAHELFTTYGPAMAYVAVESPAGDQSIGTAFHVGEGVFVTAAHVVAGNTITEVATTQRALIRLTADAAQESQTIVRMGEESWPAHFIPAAVLRIEEGPFVATNPLVDVAAFRVSSIDARTPWVPLGDHLDDWLGQSDFVLTEAVVFGYPPIPLATRPVLVGARAEVNAIVDRYDAPYVHFVLSAMPRGGFSGGVALSEMGMALGVVTNSLMADAQAPELGFLAVASVEPIYNCLADHKLMPQCQAEGWDDFWAATTLHFFDPDEDVGGGHTIRSSVEVVDDGRALALLLDPPTTHRDRVIAASCAELGDLEGGRSEAGGLGLRVDLLPADLSLSRLRLCRAARAAAAILVEIGLRPLQPIEEVFPLPLETGP